MKHMLATQHISVIINSRNTNTATILNTILTNDAVLNINYSFSSIISTFMYINYLPDKV